jgi:hypothetical protein
MVEAVRGGHCEPYAVVREFTRARLRGRPQVAGAVEALLAEARGMAEERLMELVRVGGLPDPCWNVELWLPGGPCLGEVDAYWPDHGVVVEIDARVPCRQEPASAERRVREREPLVAEGPHPPARAPETGPAKTWATETPPSETPAGGTTASETPAPETGISDTPGSETLGTETPGRETPTPEARVSGTPTPEASASEAEAFERWVEEGRAAGARGSEEAAGDGDSDQDPAWAERMRRRASLERLGVTVLHLTPRKLREPAEPQVSLLRATLLRAAAKDPGGYLVVLPR